MVAVPSIGDQHYYLLAHRPRLLRRDGRRSPFSRTKEGRSIAARCYAAGPPERRGRGGVLATAWELPGSQVLAKDKGQERAANNGIDLLAGDELVVTVSADETAVQIEVTRETSFVFGRVLGLDTLERQLWALKVDGNGSAIHEETVKYGSQNTVCAASQPSCADPTLDAQTGTPLGVTRDGLTYRFGNTTSNCDGFNGVKFVRLVK